MNLASLLKEIYREYDRDKDKGEKADYIPELNRADINDLAISIYPLDGKESIVGVGERKFTLQSISKPLGLLLAIMDNGIDRVLNKIDIKPTTDNFNQFYKLDLKGDYKPSNPMINLGAISTTSLIRGHGEKRIDRILKLVRDISNNYSIDYNQDIYESEKLTGFRNKSMAYMLKEIGNIEEDPEIVLDDYFKQCSIEVDISDLGKIAYFFASHGVRYDDQKQMIDKDIVRFINSIISTSGMYNYSGEYAARVGIPSKSGVSGSIMGLVPNKMGIAVYSPGLDEYGNSKIGIKVMEKLSNKMNLSIF